MKSFRVIAQDMNSNARISAVIYAECAPSALRQAAPELNERNFYVASITEF